MANREDKQTPVSCILAYTDQNVTASCETTGMFVQENCMEYHTSKEMKGRFICAAVSLYFYHGNCKLPQIGQTD